jgi:hypothetical protein
MKNLCTSFLLWCIVLGCTAQKKTNNTTNIKEGKVMETIFKQALTNYDIKLEREHSSKQCNWVLTATSKKGMMYVLEKDSIITDDVMPNVENDFEQKIQLYNAINAFEIDGKLYVAYNKFGTTQLMRFEVNGEKVLAEKKILKNGLATVSLGGMNYYGSHKILDDNVYVYIHTGQLYTGITGSFYKVNIPTFSIQQILFSNNIAPIATMQISDFSKNWMAQAKEKKERWEKMSVKEQAQQPDLKPLEESSKKLQLLQQYQDKPISYILLDAERDKRTDQQAEWSNIGLDAYAIFRDKSNIHKADIFLKEAITFSAKKQQGNINYLGFIEGKEFYNTISSSINDNHFYFFYKDGIHDDVQIARYNNHPMVAQWFIGAYTTQRVEEIDKK